MARRGLQAEILARLAVVMLTATAILAAVLVRIHEAHVGELGRLAARALWEEAREPMPLSPPAWHTALWWTRRPDGAWLPRGGAG